MFGVFDSVAEFATNVAKIVIAPVEMVTDLANAAAKPLAELADELKEDIKDLSK